VSGRTPRFGFTTLDSSSDTIAVQGYKTFGADRETMDRLLAYAVERHVHSGVAATTEPPAPPTLELAATGGSLPANQAIYYRTSIVNAFGQEAQASLAAVVHTPSQVVVPDPPLILPSTGTLLPGVYQYAVSAITDGADRETPVSAPATGQLAAIGGWTLVLPAKPSGAIGFNIYCKGPTDFELLRVGSITGDSLVAGDTVVIDETGSPGNIRTAPRVNTTSSTSSVSITTPLASGSTCKIYRTFDPTDWENSLLTWTAVLPYTDTGGATRTGFPPATSAAIGGAPKVDLADEVTGVPPPGVITPTTTITFTFEGSVETGIGPWQWVNEFDAAHLLSFRAHLGRNSSPATQPVIVTLERRAAFGDWIRFQSSVDLTDIVTEIPVGATIGTPTVVDETILPSPTLSSGDALRVVVLQSGGGATPTDSDLTVTAKFAVQHGSTTLTYPWEP
jgi:hypothetical protein